MPMKAVMLEVDPRILEERRRTGIDRFDEMWEGVLHMAAAPNVLHQDIVRFIESFLEQHWMRRSGGKALHQLNVSTPERWPNDYRIPDVSAMRAARGDATYVEPTAVFEVRSPGDESHEKLPFYASVGVEAAVIVDRDTRAVEVFDLRGGAAVAVAPGEGGWTLVAPLGVEARAMTGAEGPRLVLRMAGEPATERAI
jgi:hypothetical protein